MGSSTTTAPSSYPTVLDESGRAGIDTYIRKHTADLLAVGFTRLGDVRVMPASVGDVVGRIFVAPDGSTFVAALFQGTHPVGPEKVFHYWPRALPSSAIPSSPAAGTRRAPMARATAIAASGPAPNACRAVFPDEHDPITLAQLHAEAVAKFVAESGHPPLRHIRFEEYIRLQAMLTEEERRLHADHPYTLSDHLRWYLQLPRREYRG